ncbi:hypothetical protein V5799_008133 [Amblyomma americanum]|uniref:Uncharacterized protein n=1 Tax=Amblyomma americanum TaxID=6943 RepID=A0AAQ4FE02_AMBAM
MFRDALQDDSTFAAQFANSVFLVYGPITEEFGKECVELLSQGRKIRRIVAEGHLDMSANEVYNIEDVSVSSEVADVPEPDCSAVESYDALDICTSSQATDMTLESKVFLTHTMRAHMQAPGSVIPLVQHSSGGHPREHRKSTEICVLAPHPCSMKPTRQRLHWRPPC